VNVLRRGNRHGLASPKKYCRALNREGAAGRDLLWRRPSNLAGRTDVEQRKESPPKLHQTIEAVWGRQFPDAKKLVKILARCKRRRRCMSGACPECGRAFQRWFVSQVVDLAGEADPDDLHSTSIVFLNHRTAEDQLNALDTTGMKRSISETIKDADGLEWMAGGIDLSLNDDRQKKQGIAWQPQFYGLADITNVQALSNLLRGTYSPTKTAPKPVQIKECDGSTKVISYAFKTDFVRRIAYRTEVGPPDRRRKCWQTRKVSLRASEHVQAMLWMDKIGLAGRLFLRGVRMTRTGNSVGLVQMKKLE
jgi:hypothetical protein